MSWRKPITYLRGYELKRARRVLEERGGRREQTLRERDERELIERWVDPAG